MERKKIKLAPPPRVRPDMIEEARLGDFVLYQTRRSSPLWRAFKLIHLTRPGGRTKRNWWFAHDGKRFNGTRDIGLLRKHEPDVFSWLENVLAKLNKNQGQPQP